MRRKAIHKSINKMPRPVQRMLKGAAQLLPNRLLYGRRYLEAREFLRESQWWSTADLRNYQEDKLRELIRHAYENVPYYRDLFNDRGLRPDDVRTVEDLKKLPFLTKDKIRENYDRLKAQNIPESDRVVSHTSGSTGQPFEFEETADATSLERAFMNRVFSAHDTDVYHDKTVWLRSYSPDQGDPIYRYDPHVASLYLSPFHISRERIPEYVRHINDYGADTLVGYPSSIYIFATLLEKTDYQLQHVRAVHTGSEQLIDEWRDRIESVLGVPVYDHYGMAEKVGLFHQCPESSAYHENLEYGVVEIADPQNGTGEVVGTSLFNYAMPLIRYRMGDRATLHRGDTACPCGRGLPLTIETFEGRTDDLLQTPDGRILPGVNFYTLMYSVEGVDMFKIVQDVVNEVNVRVVVGNEFSAEQRQQLTAGLRNRLGEEISINLRVVNSIERDESTGKIRCIESNIDDENEH